MGSNNVTYKGFIGLDLDGTVFNNEKIIPNEVVEAIHRALKNGFLVSPVTGRPMNGVPHEFVNDINSEYIIASNGSTIYKRISDSDIEKAIQKKSISEEDGIIKLYETFYECIYRNPLSKETALSVLDILDDFDCVPDCFVWGKGHMREDAKIIVPLLGISMPMVEYILSRRDFFPDLKEYVSNLNDGVEKITINFYMNEAGKKEKERALERLNKMDNITIVSGAPHNLEVNAKDVSKGKGIYKLCDLLNINRKRTCACGDDINDLDMIKLSGFGVAMGNAVPAVKSAADFITDTNEEAGVAKAIYKFMDIEYLKNS